MMNSKDRTEPNHHGGTVGMHSTAPDYTRPQHTQEHTKADRRSLRPTSQRPLQRHRDGGRSGGPSLHARCQVASLVSQRRGAGGAIEVPTDQDHDSESETQDHDQAR